MSTADHWVTQAADRLAAIHDRSFGGKPAGRYRIAVKLLRRAAGKRRLYESDIRDLTRAMFERGYVLVDMDGFYVVMSANSFVNYRRANEDCLR